MKKKIRVISILLITVILLCGCDMELTEQSVLGAHGEDESMETESIKLTEVSVLYYSDMDTNPVTTDCLANSEVLKLVYSPLLRVGSNFKAVCVLAESYSVDANTVTVKIRSDITFSNGEPVTAYDAVKTYNVVNLNRNSPYYLSVSRMSKYYAADEKTIVCTFKQTDVDVEALLDIPIMYNGQEGVGCGPYVMSEKNGKPVLVINETYFEKANVPLIKLIETKSDEYITSMFSAGELDVLSIQGSDDLSLTSLRNYTTVSYPSNNLLYIGANAQLGDASVRRAVSECIDRGKIADQTLGGLADGSVYPFSPLWYKVSSRHADCEYDSAAAESSATVLKDIKLTLLIPSGSDVKTAVANGIAEQFKALGLTLEVVEKSPEEYLQLVQSGRFDLYLGESAIARDMDPTYIYSQGGALNFTGVSDPELDTMFEQYKLGKIDITAYLDKFLEIMPIVPVAFRKNVMYCTSGMTNFSAQSPWNMFGNVTSITLE